jgi:SAM-dependent methyltransferase
MDHVLSAVAARMNAYLACEISGKISEHDDMFARGLQGAIEHYFQVGRSAIDIIAQAMIASGKIDFETILDLPCGGGRVTRHLAALLPTAKLFVGDLDKRKESFVVETFRASPVRVAPDFRSAPELRFDLIFVGSLVTHFDAGLFEYAVRWFLAALADGGLLVLTTHGRRHDHIERTLHHYFDAPKWDAVRRACSQFGFGYVETERNGVLSYGANWSAPSWLMRLVENDPSTRILNFQEAAWDNHQDVLVLQGRAIIDH